MKNPFPVVHIVLALPVADLSAYSDAVISLTRTLGDRAPDIVELMAHTLRCRDSQGLVEDYLESINEPANVPVSNHSARMPRKIVQSKKRVHPISVLTVEPSIISGRN